MNTNALIRPAWTPATIALMVLGFMVFWPLGFAMPAQLHQQQATSAAPAAPQSPAQQQRWWGSGVRQQ